MKTSFFIVLSFCLISFPNLLMSQRLQGRVIEMVNGKASGIGDISVTIKDFSYAITNQNGEFAMGIPTDKNHVKIFLENTNRQLIAPLDGLVDLPPPNRVEIIVCGQQNKRLREEVDKLNKKVKSFQVKYQISEKKAGETYKEMLDTILHYEQRIQALDAQKEKMQAQSNAEIQRLQTEIDRLKLVEESLLRQLLEAKDEYFLKKQAYLQQITADLRQYLDALQNLQMMVMPDRIAEYFISYGAATKKLSDKIDAYDIARNAILKNQDANLSATRHYWEDPSVANQLQEIYQFLLVDVHDRHVLSMESSIVGVLKKFSTGKLGRQEAQKTAKKASSAAYPQLTTIIPILEEKINSIALKLKQFF